MPRKNHRKTYKTSTKKQHQDLQNVKKSPKIQSYKHGVNYEETNGTMIQEVIPPEVDMNKSADSESPFKKLFNSSVERAMNDDTSGDYRLQCEFYDMMGKTEYLDRVFTKGQKLRFMRWYLNKQIDKKFKEEVKGVFWIFNSWPATCYELTFCNLFMILAENFDQKNRMNKSSMESFCFCSNEQLVCENHDFKNQCQDKNQCSAKSAKILSFQKTDDWLANIDLDSCSKLYTRLVKEDMSKFLISQFHEVSLWGDILKSTRCKHLLYWQLDQHKDRLHEKSIKMFNILCLKNGTILLKKIRKYLLLHYHKQKYNVVTKNDLEEKAYLNPDFIRFYEKFKWVLYDSERTYDDSAVAETGIDEVD